MKKQTRPGPPKVKPETANKITANVLRALNLQPNVVAYRVNNTGIWDEKKQLFRRANTQKGLPDIFACIRGRFVGFEIKAGADKQSTEQKIVEQEIKLAKGDYVIIRSTSDIEIYISNLNHGR